MSIPPTPSRHPLMTIAPTRVLLAALALALTTAAQQVQVGAASYARHSSAVFFYAKTDKAFDVFGQCEVTYGAPRWSAAHGEALAKATAGTRLRLGKDGWTLLDTNVALLADKRTIPAGCHYLAIEARGDGELALLVLDAAAVRKRKLFASLTEQTKGGTAIPLRRIAAPEGGREAAAELGIGWQRKAKDSNDVELVLRFGDREYRATLTPALDGKKAG